MKPVVIACLLSLLPPSMEALAPRAHAGDGAPQGRAIFVGRPAGSTAEATTFTTEDGKRMTVVVHADADAPAPDGRSEQVQARVIHVAGDDEEGAEQRAWLGVSIAEAPEEVVAQLGPEAGGVLIRQVAPDSPAQKAGLQAHDIIIAMNGESVPRDVGVLVDRIRTFQPGDTVSVTVLRAGQEHTVDVELGSRAQAGDLTWTLKLAPQGEIEDITKIRGKILKQGPGGTWIAKDLGNLNDLSELPDHIRQFLPEGGSTSTKIVVHDGKRTVRTHITREDGSSLVVEQENEGEITVRRTDADGQETVNAYADAAALEAADPEAHATFQQAGGVIVAELDIDGLKGVVDSELPDLDIDLHGAEWAQDVEAWKEKLNERLQSAQESLEQYRQRMEELMAQWEEEGAWKGHPFGPLPLLMGEEGDQPLAALSLLAPDKPRHSFEMLDDGRIEVRSRRGDTELVRVYENEADLRTRAPQLHEKYRALLEAED